jgi:hypothetical protein
MNAKTMTEQNTTNAPPAVMLTAERVIVSIPVPTKRFCKTRNEALAVMLIAMAANPGTDTANTTDPEKGSNTMTAHPANDTTMADSLSNDIRSSPRADPMTHMTIGMSCRNNEVVTGDVQYTA